MSLLKTAIILAGTLVFAGCASVPSQALIQEAGQRPDDAQAASVIRQHLRRALRDPDAMKDFALRRSAVLATATNLGGNREQSWLVCVEYNSTNAMGGYVGLRTYGYYLRRSGDTWLVESGVNWRSVDLRC